MQFNYYAAMRELAQMFLAGSITTEEYINASDVVLFWEGV